MQRNRHAEAHLLEHNELAAGKATEDGDDDQSSPAIIRPVELTP